MRIGSALPSNLGGACMGEILSVVSGKGGTGKTTLCAGIASCLAAEDKRVLCIDADIGLETWAG